MLQTKFVLPSVLAGLLAGCSQTGPASVAGGECKLFEAPTQHIATADEYSGGWVAETVEVGIAVCGWARVKAPVVAKDEEPKRRWFGL